MYVYMGGCMYVCSSAEARPWVAAGRLLAWLYMYVCMYNI